MMPHHGTWTDFAACEGIAEARGQLGLTRLLLNEAVADAMTLGDVLDAHPN